MISEIRYWNFLARFPVSVMSVRTTREKTSGAIGTIGQNIQKYLPSCALTFHSVRFQNIVTRIELPWVPEVFLARFPVSVMSVRTTREKTSGTQGRIELALHLRNWNRCHRLTRLSSFTLCYDFYIHSAISLSAVRQVAVSKADQAPTLRAIIPYLEASNNQEYLIQRLSGLFIKFSHFIFWDSRTCVLHPHVPSLFVFHD